MKKIFTLFVAFLALTFCAKAQVTIILEAHDVWGDGSGYQLLLDADHNTYGTIIPTSGALTTSGDVPASVYAEFEYTVPVGADGSLTTTNMVYDGTATITIPAGTYDFCITNPTPGDRMWIASGNADPTRADDYVFVDGNTYHFLMVANSSTGNDECHLTITVNPTSPMIVPVPATVDFGGVSLGNTANATVTVNNYLLTSNVTATTAAPFAISADGVTFGTTATIPATGGTLNVRYTPTVAGTDNGTITLTSTGATDVTVTLTGSGVDCSGASIPYSFAFDNEAMLNCWQVIDANNDGFTFDFTSGYAYYSYNSDDNTIGADDWLISPNFTFSGSEVISFDYAVASSYYPEKFQAFALGADTVTLTDVITATNTTFQTQYVAASSLTGVYAIGIHCVSDADEYQLGITNFNISGLAAPEVTLEGPAEAPANTAVTFTAISPLANSFAWTVDGTAVTETSDELTHTFTTLGDHTVIVAATNTAGTSYDTATIVIFDCGAITTFPFTNGFETGTARCWTMISNDPANDDRFGVYEDEAAYEGIYDFRFSSFHSASDYNQYLITPELQLPSTGEYMVNFHYKGYTSTENFRVMASTTTNDIASFTELADYQTTPTEWDEVTLLLPAGTKYVAINYYGNYRYYLYVDAFSIETLGAPTVSVSGPTSVSAGSPATFTANAPLATSFAWTVDGTAVSSTTNTMTHTFTTGGNHTVAVTASNSEGSSTASMTVDVFTCDQITTFPYSDDFENEGTLGCWTFIDADGDGYFWDPSFCRDQVNQNTGAGYGNNGSYGIVASASYINNVGALTPDNWFISPEIVLPATGSYVFTWYAKGQDASYAEEHYAVYVSTTGANTSDFTTVLYEGESTGEWAMYSANLSAYAGQTIRLAFRHYNVTDMFWLDIDDISIDLIGAPTVSISGPSSVISGSPATFTAIAPLATSFAWTVDGTAVSSTTNTMTHTFTTGGNHTVAVTASNSEGSATASMTVNVFSCDAITSFPYNENFENEATLDCWTFIDADGDGFNWDPSYLRDQVDDETGQGYAHNGSYGMVASASYYSGTQSPLTPDNWLISPEIVIPANYSNVTLSWYTKGQDPSYAEEHYAVLVSTTGASTSSFTTNLYEGETTGDWEQHTANLSAYAGQTIRIAFRHYNVTDMFWLDLDDINIDGVVGIDNHDMNVSIYPNPANNVLNINANSNINRVEVYNMMGQMVGMYEANDMNTQISTTALANGVYTVRIATENGMSTQKFTVAR